jgi:hypothetical protein
MGTFMIAGFVKIDPADACECMPTVGIEDQFHEEKMVWLMS